MPDENSPMETGFVPDVMGGEHYQRALAALPPAAGQQPPAQPPAPAQGTPAAPATTPSAPAPGAGQAQPGGVPQGTPPPAPPQPGSPAQAPAATPPAPAPAALPMPDFVALSRREADALAAEERHRAAVAEFEAQRAAFNADLQALQAIRSGDPAKGFEALGVKWGDVATRAMQGGGQQGELGAQVTEQLRAMEAKLLEQQQQAEQARQAAETARRVAEVRGTLTPPAEDPQRWGLLQEMPDYAEQVIEGQRIAAANGFGNLTLHEVADRMEAYLVAQEQARLANSKRAALFGQVPPTPAQQLPGSQGAPQAPAAGTAPAASVPPTLSNGVQTTPGDRRDEDRLLTDEEYRARAMAVIDIPE